VIFTYFFKNVIFKLAYELEFDGYIVYFIIRSTFFMFYVDCLVYHVKRWFEGSRTPLNSSCVYIHERILFCYYTLSKKM